MSSTIVVVPREATATKLHLVTKAQATDAGAFLEHDVCLREKTTTVATCPEGSATPKVGVQIPMNTAKFFSQLWSVSNGDKVKFDTVELASELSVVGDCNTTASMANCVL